MRNQDLDSVRVLVQVHLYSLNPKCARYQNIREIDWDLRVVSRSYTAHESGLFQYRVIS